MFSYLRTDFINSANSIISFGGILRIDVLFESSLVKV